MLGLHHGGRRQELGMGSCILISFSEFQDLPYFVFLVATGSVGGMRWYLFPCKLYVCVCVVYMHPCIHLCGSHRPTWCVISQAKHVAHVCVCVFMFSGVWVHVGHTCMRVYVEARDGCQMSLSVALHIIYLSRASHKTRSLLVPASLSLRSPVSGL